MITNRTVRRWETFQSRKLARSNRHGRTFQFENLIATPDLVLRGKRRCIVVTQATAFAVIHNPGVIERQRAILNAYVSISALLRRPDQSEVMAVLSQNNTQHAIAFGYSQITLAAEAILNNKRPLVPTSVVDVLSGQSIYTSSGGAQRLRPSNHNAPEQNGQKSSRLLGSL